MEITTCVLMTKKHLEKYIELLDERIIYLKSKGRVACLDEEIQTYVRMRNHAFNALEVFR